jgi:acetolactate synthase-1/2/3 large subunit
MTADKKLKGSEALVAALEHEGCEVMFGFPGGVAIPFYDALYDAKKLRHVLVRHEQGAAHAADGYARATGKVGVCVSTSGPGATNLVTGIATAYLDSSPLVAITWQVRSDLIGTDAFQEADITGITLPIVKHSYLVKKTAELPQVVHEAFHIASTGRPGPVVIDIPVDVALGEVAYHDADTLDLPGYKPTVRGHIKQIRAAAKAINEAQRPVLYLGGGVVSAGAAPEILRLAELRRLPVATTLMGIGAFPETHELAMGMLGMHGTVTANYAVHECDLLINLGARFDDRVTGKLKAFAPHAKVIHADVDPAEIGKNVPPLIPIVGDVKQVAAGLVKELEGMEWPAERTSEWLARIAARKEEYPLHYEAPKDGKLAPQLVVEEIDRVTRCGRRSTTPTPSRGNSSAPAALGPWASACRRASAPRSGAPTRPWSTSAATAASR